MSSSEDEEFYYSHKYEDDEYEYRHVHCPRRVRDMIPKNRLMSEQEWRSLGVQQSIGWVHYAIHGPERHVLLFRRKLPMKKPEVKQAMKVTSKKISGR